MRGLSIILVISLCYYCFGCYNTRVLKQEDEILKCLKQKEGIHYITSRNSERYSFKDHHYNYKFENDTLYGRAQKVSSKAWEKFEHIQFPISEINEIETQEIDIITTGIVTGIIGIGIYLFVRNNELINPWYY